LTLVLFAYKVSDEVLVIEQRKSKRFELKLPLELVRAGAVAVGRVGETRNVSSSGVLFRTDMEMQIGSPIEYLITLPVTSADAPEVRLLCVGKIIRQEDHRTAAATLERYEFVRT
jgi:hypothetical protein